ACAPLPPTQPRRALPLAPARRETSTAARSPSATPGDRLRIPTSSTMCTFSSCPSAPRALAGLLGGPALADDVDPPAGQPSGQPGILALFADRQGELVVRHDPLRG